MNKWKAINAKAICRSPIGLIMSVKHFTGYFIVTKEHRPPNSRNQVGCVPASIPHIEITACNASSLSDKQKFVIE